MVKPQASMRLKTLAVDSEKAVARLLSADGRPATGFSHDVCDAFLRGVLASRRDLAVVAGSERFSLVVTDDGSLAAQHAQRLVADDGPGILAEAREKVFQRFFRLERSRSTAGSGLGLSLVTAVADIHGITVRLADNEPGLKVVLEFASRKPT